MYSSFRHMQSNVTSCTLLVTPPACLKSLQHHHSEVSQWHLTTEHYETTQG